MIIYDYESLQWWLIDLKRKRKRKGNFRSRFSIPLLLWMQNAWFLPHEIPLSSSHQCNLASFFKASSRALKVFLTSIYTAYFSLTALILPLQPAARILTSDHERLSSPVWIKRLKVVHLSQCARWEWVRIALLQRPSQRSPPVRLAWNKSAKCRNSKETEGC